MEAYEEERKGINKKGNWFLDNYFLLLTIVTAFIFLLYKVSDAYVGLYAFCNGFTVILAENYSKLGFLHTKLAPAIYNLRGESPWLYLRHPFSFFMLAGLVYKIYASVLFLRMVIIAFSIGAVIYFNKITQALFQNRMLTNVATVFFALNPMMLYYGKILNYEPVLLFFMLLVSYLIITNAKLDKAGIIKIALLLFVAASIDWPMAFMAGVLFVYSFFYKKTDRLKMLFLSSVPIIFYIGFTTYERTFFGLNALLVGGKGRMAFNLLFTHKLWSVIKERLLDLYTPVLICGAAIFFVYLIKELIIKRTRIDKADLKKYFWVLSFFVIGLVNIAAFPDAAYIHEFWLYYFLPFFALSTAVVLVMLRNKFLIAIPVILFLILAYNGYHRPYEWANYQHNIINKTISYVGQHRGRKTLFISDPVSVIEVRAKTGTVAAYYEGFENRLPEFSRMNKSEMFDTVIVGYDMFTNKNIIKSQLEKTFGKGKVKLNFSDDDRLMVARFN